MDYRREWSTGGNGLQEGMEYRREWSTAEAPPMAALFMIAKIVDDDS